MEYTQIEYEVSDSILTITLNRPEKLNADTPVMRAEVMDALNRADEDDDIRVIITTGAGKAYCAGADLSVLNNPGNKVSEGGDKVSIDDYQDGGGIVTLRMYDMKKPMIAAINGPAVGYGLTQTLPMDIRLASENARMGFVFARRGLVNEACSSWFLSRIVGMSQAAEWILTGRVFDAREALSGGLVSEVLTPERLIPRAREIAAEIVRNTSSISVALSRQMLWKMAGADHPMEAFKIDSKGMYYMKGGADMKEGVGSFIGKRAPNFPMKVSTDMPDFYPWWSERSFK
jgi:enoyl-CoA hydratase/carnithine racemase